LASPLLYGFDAFDLPGVLEAMLAVVFAAAAGMVVPLRRALSIEPSEALRRD
jgi:hypothetical protein